MRDVGAFKYIISIVVVVLLSISVAYSGDRKTTSVYDSGKKTESGHTIFKNRTLLDPGECDLIRVWKPIVDPTFGTFYTLLKYKLCRGMM